MQTGTVSAIVGGKTFGSRQLIVRPMGLESLTLSAPTVVGGTKVIGTARLECKAGKGRLPCASEATARRLRLLSPWTS